MLPRPTARGRGGPELPQAMVNSVFIPKSARLKSEKSTTWVSPKQATWNLNFEISFCSSCEHSLTQIPNWEMKSEICILLEGEPCTLSTLKSVFWNLSRWFLSSPQVCLAFAFCILKSKSAHDSCPTWPIRLRNLKFEICGLPQPLQISSNLKSAFCFLLSSLLGRRTWSTEIWNLKSAMKNSWLCLVCRNLPSARFYIPKSAWMQNMGGFWALKSVVSTRATHTRASSFTEPGL